MERQSETARAPGAPAGWYGDPDQAGTQRYWDGERWTDQRTPATPAAPAPTAAGLPIGVWAASLGILVTLISLFLPYVETTTFGDITQNSLIQHAEGVIILILALVAAVATYWRVNGKGWRWTVGALGALILGAAIWLIASPPELHSAASTEGLNLREALEVMTASETASAGIGLYAAALGGLLILVGGFSLRRRPAADQGA